MTIGPTEDAAAYAEAWGRELRAQSTYFDLARTSTEELIGRWDRWMASWCEAVTIGVREDYPVAYLMSARTAYAALAERRLASDPVARHFFEPFGDA